MGLPNTNLMHLSQLRSEPRGSSVMMHLSRNFKVLDIGADLLACRFSIVYTSGSVLRNCMIPSSPFHYRTTRRTAKRHRYMVNIPPIRSKRFGNTFIMRTGKEWNSLLESVFPDTT
ncbi:hypothetical protein PYW07_016216 [Mythimna separata]|uniref:Uncharacterized protein n=1 Tax=Mythimna separata TaxID=271217 RepID=A0AAD7YRH8_MYTSE|nr:hypothetical protein PYW07_016216 [Mythimna separata]